MKKVMMWGMWMLAALTGMAQSKVDEQRMQQDIMVAENILSTLMKQQLGRRNFFPVDINGTYAPGYGVTFRLPHNGIFSKMMVESWGMGAPAMVDIDMNGNSYSYFYRSEEENEAPVASPQEKSAAVVAGKQRSKSPQARTKISSSSMPDSDSAAVALNQRFLEVAKNFLADYGDVLSQLKPNERIIITNRAGGFDGDLEFRFPGMESTRRSVVSAEAIKDDITSLKQGKLTRNQFLAKLKIVNSQVSDELDPDLEVLSSLMNRLYREDLSKTYFVQGDVNYERLKDFGVVYYMTVYSSYEQGEHFFMVPAAGLKNADQQERDAKVKELYPKFESDLKENIVEYGRTLRSLGDDEQLVFTVRLTRCNGCGLPVELEMSIKNSALKDYSLGKATKEATLAKVNVKKTGVQ